MANDVDEFTIKYKVDTGDAAKKIHDFNDKLDKTGKTSHKGKGFVADLGKEIGGMATSALKAGAIVTTVMATVYKAIKQVSDAVADYNEQMLVMRRTGISTLSQEIISLNLARSSGGAMSHADSRRTMDQIAGVVNSAYTDPTRMNQQNMRLRMMGISPTGQNGNIASSKQVMNELSERWRGMTKDMAEAEGDLLGITAIATNSIRDMGGAVDDTSGITLKMMERQAEAATQAIKLGDAINGIETDLKTLTKVLVDDSMKALADFFGLIKEGTGNLSTTFNKEGVVEGTKHLGRALWADLKERVGAGKGDKVKSLSEHLKDTENAESAEDHAKAVELAEKQDEAAEKNRQAAKKLELTANQFATAVAAMPGSLTEQEAIAAWAGEAGKGMTTGGAGYIGSSNGSGGSSTGRGSGGGGGGGGGGFLNAVAQIESNNSNVAQKVIDINTRKGTPAGGYFQIIDPTWKRYAAAAGVDTGKYPNAMSAPRDIQAKVAAQIPANQFGPRTQRMLHEQFGSFDKNKTLGALDQQFGGSGGKLPGMGLDTGGQLIAARGIGSAIGVSGEQLLGGRVSRGDAQYGLEKQRFGLTQKIYELKGKIAGADSAGRGPLKSQYEGELHRTQNQLMHLEKYGADAVDRARPGGQERTKGQAPIPKIDIFINSNQDPQEIARLMGIEMQKALNEHQTKYAS